MKRLKLGILYGMIICLSVGIEASADILVNQPEKNEPSPGQNLLIKGEKDTHDGKVVILHISGKHGVEVKPQDEPDEMTWDAAVMAVQEHGSGWRLPTIVELRILYEQRKRIGGFSDEDYWSSTERDVNSAWIQGFRLGDQDRYVKQSKLKVRAVRSF